MRNKRIFISGGAGVIGRELVTKLHTLGAKIFVGDLKPMPEDWSGDILYRQGDLNYVKKEELEMFNPEIFIHLAATFERSTETYEFWEENFWHNVRLSNYLISLLKDSKYLKRVIFPSSYLIYDPKLYSFDDAQKKARRLKETDVIFPRNLTGSAKLMHEVELNFLKTFKHKQFTTVSLRIFRGYGRGSRCVISRWVRELINGNSIQVYKKEGLFDYIFAGDIANGIIKVLENENITGIINLGNDNARKVEDVVNIIKTYFNDSNIKEVVSDIPYEASQANMDLFKHKTGWIPQMQLEDTIPLIIEYEKQKLQELKKKQKNVLITSVSNKIPLVENVKNAANKIGVNMKIFGGDITNNCLGVYFADDFWLMPRTNKLTPEKLIKYCEENNINAIIPTRDGELKYFAKIKKILASENISIMVSEAETIDFCFDKLKFYKDTLEREIPIIPTYDNIEEIDAQCFVIKEQFGAGSDKIGINLNKEEAIDRSKKLLNPIFQPFIKGREASVDMYIAKDGKVKGIVMRYRDKVVNGESRITTTFYDLKLKKLCQDFISFKTFYGHIILQVIIDKNNNYNIIECNPRFGGASTLSITAGLDSFYWFLLESQNIDISDYIFNYNKDLKIMQIRYPKDKIIIL